MALATPEQEAWHDLIGLINAPAAEEDAYTAWLAGLDANAGTGRLGGPSTQNRHAAAIRGQHSPQRRHAAAPMATGPGAGRTARTAAPGEAYQVTLRRAGRWGFGFELSAATDGNGLVVSGFFPDPAGRGTGTGKAQSPAFAAGVAVGSRLLAVGERRVQSDIEVSAALQQELAVAGASGGVTFALEAPLPSVELPSPKRKRGGVPTLPVTFNERMFPSADAEEIDDDERQRRRQALLKAQQAVASRPLIPELAMLRPGDKVLCVEYCSATNLMTTHTDAAVYRERALQLQEGLRELRPALAVVSLPTVPRATPWAFEVTLAVMQYDGTLSRMVLFSKLASRRWPTASLIGKLVAEQMKGQQGAVLGGPAAAKAARSVEHRMREAAHAAVLTTKSREAKKQEADRAAQAGGRGGRKRPPPLVRVPSAELTAEELRAELASPLAMRRQERVLQGEEDARDAEAAEQAKAIRAEEAAKIEALQQEQLRVQHAEEEAFAVSARAQAEERRQQDEQVRRVQSGLQEEREERERQAEQAGQAELDQRESEQRAAADAEARAQSQRAAAADAQRAAEQEAKQQERDASRRPAETVAAQAGLPFESAPAADAKSSSAREPAAPAVAAEAFPVVAAAESVPVRTIKKSESGKNWRQKEREAKASAADARKKRKEAQEKLEAEEKARKLQAEADETARLTREAAAEEANAEERRREQAVQDRVEAELHPSDDEELKIQLMAAIAAGDTDAMEALMAKMAA